MQYRHYDCLAKNISTHHIRSGGTRSTRLIRSKLIAARRKFVFSNSAIPCGADCGAAVPSVLTDGHSIYSLFCLFLFVKCPWVP